MSNQVLLESVRKIIINYQKSNSQKMKTSDIPSIQQIQTYIQNKHKDPNKSFTFKNRTAEAYDSKIANEIIMYLEEGNKL